MLIATHSTVGRTACALACAAAAFQTAALAADIVAYGPPPAWVTPQQAPVTVPGDSSTPVRILLLDVQLNLAPKISESYLDSVLLVQTPQGLATVGTIALSWRPDTDLLTVNKLNIVRDNRVIDVLSSGQKFSILRREDKLEYAVLSGALTAVIQPEGLRVGDRVELAYSLRRIDTLLGGVPEQAIATEPGASIARVHLSARWPADYSLTWQASRFLDKLKEEYLGNARQISTTRENDEPLVQPTGAPARFAAVRLIQLTGHKSWTEVSKLLYPLFDNASVLSRTSPLQQELARIRAASPDLQSRVEAALRLVQDQVRYVYLGMNDARIVPADVDTTWSRRYGDCKAKTALLLALLHALNVDAEAVAVNTVAGDSLPERLPMIAMFNHVLVRATVAGKVYWLDGSRNGDRRLDALLAPTFRWGLPIAAAGGELLKIQAVPPAMPLTETTIFVDASAGAKSSATFQTETLFRGDSATAVEQGIAGLTPSQRDAALRTYWTRQNYWSNNWEQVTVRAVKADFDDATGVLRLTMDGQGTMNWQADQHLLGPLSIGDYVDYRREPGSNSDAPFLTNFPSYSLVTERIKLPNAGAGYSIVGTDIDRTIAGVHYHRSAKIEEGEVSAEASVRSIDTEFPASEAPAAQKALREMWDNYLYAKLPLD